MTMPSGPFNKGGMAFAGEASPLQRSDSISKNILRETRRSGGDGDIDLALHKIEQHGVSQAAPLDRDARRLDPQMRVQAGKQRECEIGCAQSENPSRRSGIE